MRRHLAMAPALLLLLATATAQGAAPPEFVDGDPGALQCRVLAAKPVGDLAQILTVEVHNRGTEPAEPLVFGIELPQRRSEPARSETFARVQLPHVARYGRPVPPGGKHSYEVRTTLPGKKAAFTVRVEVASFVRGGAVDQPPIAIGTPEQVQRESFVGVFPVTKVALTNPLPVAVDVLLRVAFVQPSDRVDLVGARIEAGRTRDLVLATVPGTTAWLDPLSEAPGCAVKATEFELVDWSLVGTMPDGAAAAVLRAAYEGWHRWPDGTPAPSGSFTLRERRVKVNSTEYEDFLVRGRFEARPDGAFAVEITDGGGAHAGHLLREAFGDLRRPSFEDLCRTNRLLLVTPARVAVVGPGWNGNGGDAARHRTGGDVVLTDCDDLEVQGGRIASEGRGELWRTTWEWREFDGRPVVVRRHDRSTDTRCSFATVDGRLVPTSLAKVVQFGDKPFSIAELQIADVRFGAAAAIAPEPPTGDGAPALRALWDAAYRLPVEPLRIEARFAITVGDDGVWRGHRELSGTVAMEGIGRSMRASDWTFDGNLARADEVQLAAVLRDRFGIWIGRDFNDRLPFDEFFRGAVVSAPDAEGTFAIDGGPVQRVFTKGGLVRGFERGHTVTRFTYARQGDRQYVTRIEEQIGGPEQPATQRWTARTTVTMTEVGGHLLPTRLAFERIFGRDWQPETLVLRDLRIR